MRASDGGHLPQNPSPILLANAAVPTGAALLHLARRRRPGRAARLHGRPRPHPGPRAAAGGALHAHLLDVDAGAGQAFGADAGGVGVFEGDGGGGSEAAGARWEGECKSHVTKSRMMSALDIAAFHLGIFRFSKFSVARGSSDFYQ